MLSSIFGKREEPKEEPITIKKDVTLIPFSDMHTGGTTAVHPEKYFIDGKWVDILEVGGWNYKHNRNFYPDARQHRIFLHLENCLNWGLEKRGDDRLIILGTGDMHDGVHHDTNQLVTRKVSEQAEAHLQLMRYIKDRLAFRAGDNLLYLEGTECHVGDEESGMAKQLGAYQFNDGSYSAPFVKLNINGCEIWAFHKGARIGDYPNRANAATLLMKRVFDLCEREKLRRPNLILTGHFHKPDYFTFTQDYHTINYVALPSWQDKTRFVTDNMPLSVNKVGMQIIKISADGHLTIPPPMLQTAEVGESVTL